MALESDTGKQPSAVKESGTANAEVRPPSITLPKGGGAIRGIGEKFAANPVTGTGALSIPIAASPGRSGFGPQLSISYDSGAGNGPFGFGWSLSIPSITRKTDKGLPQYDDAGESDVYILSGAEDLVPVLAQDGTRFEDAVSAPGYTIHRYRPRIEGLFARIERWTDQATGDIHWRSISRDNVASLYGKTGQSRIAGNDPTRVFTWLLCESYDDKGNAIVYEYAPEDDQNVDQTQANETNRSRTANRYLKRIRYGNRTSRLIQPDLAQMEWMFEVVFDYDENHSEELDLDPAIPEAEQHRYVLASASPGRAWPVRPDPFSSYRSGFEVRSYRRCRRILMFHRFAELGTEPCLVRSSEFEYADLDYTSPVTIEAELAHQGSTRFASFIRAITQSGYVRDDSRAVVEQNGVRYCTFLKKSLPPLEFEYSKAAIQEEIRQLDALSLENLPVGLDGATYQWVDLDGEGVSGILTEQAGTWFYKPSLGLGRFGPQQAVALKPPLASLGNGERTQFLDLAGDGCLDVVTFAGPTPGFQERTQDEKWEPFRTFRQLPNIAWDEPSLRFLDLDGDGLADVLITEQDVFTWYPSLGEEGFGPAQRVQQPSDEEQGPKLVLADGAQSIYLADMSGDGLSDLVRVRNGEVCYWPNLGYGRFGAKVAMDNAPWFDNPDQFNQNRIRLVDIDGSGATDIIYMGRDGVRLYFNQSGGRWSGPRFLRQFPRVVDVSSVMVVDLFGNGTACLVWSSPLPGDARSQMRYVDLMGGRKPHLLTRSVNNLGAETEVQYVASTKFYLADKLAGKPWITRIPFPVHVVECVRTQDRISGNLFVTRYAYHHGNFDGIEREFRGFGLVEQWDTEEFAALSANQALADGTNIEESSHVPPVLTRTWFHTGVYLGRDRISNFFAGLLDEGDAGEYYREPGWSDDDAKKRLLDDTVLPDSLTLEEEREACRALKGAMLHQEVYALDDTDKQEHPYTVTEQNFTIRQLQPKAGNRHAVFFTHAREVINYHYERNPTDPRVQHALTLEVDDYGDVLKSAQVGYGRRQPDLTLLEAERDQQTRTLVTYSENDFSNPIGEHDAYRTPLPSATRTYELTGLDLHGNLRFTMAEVLSAGTSADPIAYEQTAAQDALHKRLIEHVRTLYRGNDLTGPLPPRALESLALPFESYKLAFTPGLLAQVFGTRVTDAMLAGEGGYVHSEDDTGWWIPSGRVFYSPNTTDAAAAELAWARAHFFLPCRYRDPFHTDLLSTETLVRYDAYDLLPEETRDAVANRTTASYDYRVLKPALIADANGNRSAVAFDALGQVVGTAVMGKPEETPRRGDSPDDFAPNLTDAAAAAHLGNPLSDPHGILKHATSRLVYDLFAYCRTKNEAQPQPAVVYTLARETHDADLNSGELTKVQHNFSYSDGFGREIQKKIQAEPGPPPDNVSPRWVGSGWTVFNNKGKPVRKFEPFFTGTHLFEFDVRIGVSPVLFYDPVERVVATLHPNHTWEKVVFDPWRQETWDVNDTVLVGDPGSDPDVGNFFRRLPTADYLPTWYSQRQGGELGPREQAAAGKTALHANTPAAAYFDTLGRAYLTLAHNGFADGNPIQYRTRTRFDIEGNQREITDALDRLVMRYDYSIAGPAKDRKDAAANRIHQVSMDAGERWILNDVAGKPLYAWDSRDHQFRTAYDPLRRPTDSFLREGLGDEALIGRTIYGESRSNPEVSNLREKVVQVFDQAGVVTSDQYDFKGNLLRSQRQLAQSYKTTLDWPGNVALETEVFTSRTAYDALNRPTQVIAPHSDQPGTKVNVSQPVYNEASLLEQDHAWLNQDTEPEGLLDPATASLHAVTNIDYDAKGQRTQIEYGNGVATTYEYDLLTFRLVHLLTKRSPVDFPDDCPQPPPDGWPGCSLQNLSYTYDPAGNITQIRDDAQQTIYFKNKRVEPNAEYTYDAVYRLIEATGREHLGQIGGPPIPHSYNDALRAGLPHPSDGTAMGNYLERYLYDAVGNFLSMQHCGADPANAGWARAYAYTEGSLLEPGKQSNRLTSTTIGATAETYSAAGNGYDAHGNMLRMPHLQVMQWDFKDQLQTTQRQAVNVEDADGAQHQGERTWYVYDAAGQRVRKVTELAGGQVKDERIYLGGFEIYRKNGADPITRETLHIMDDKQRIALVETCAQGTDSAPQQLIRYQCGNHLGSASHELDDQAAIISYEEYTPYGSTAYQAVRSQTETPKRYQYTGMERDEESGLCYCGARYYAAWLARFASVDPLHYKYVRYTPYQYAANTPIAYIDLNGMGPGNPVTKGQGPYDYATQYSLSLDQLAEANEDVFRNYDQAWSKEQKNAYWSDLSGTNWMIHEGQTLETTSGSYTQTNRATLADVARYQGRELSTETAKLFTEYGRLVLDAIAKAAEMSSIEEVSKYITGADEKAAGELLSKIGKGFKVAGLAAEIGGVAVGTYNLIQKPTMGNEAKLEVAAFALVVNVVPIIGQGISIAICVIDAAGGFNWYYRNRDKMTIEQIKAEQENLDFLTRNAGY